jgi:hypothetical protein
LNHNITDIVQRDIKELNQKTEWVGILNGKITENTRLLEKAIAMEEIAGVSVFSMGEIDGNRVAYHKQYTQVNTELADLNAQMNLILKNLLKLKKGSTKRKKELVILGEKVAGLMNKNMLMFVLVGAMQETQYYIDSAKLSFKLAKKQ